MGNKRCSSQGKRLQIYTPVKQVKLCTQVLYFATLFTSGKSMYVALVLIVKRNDIDNVIVKEMLLLLYCSYFTAKLQKLLL